ncbi:MAG: hypothetical protein HRU19_27975 [Pseudobacteriovorax sp.]|nr:hypothetical protein [Pseudobacteriovorax sp.]
MYKLMKPIWVGLWGIILSSCGSQDIAFTEAPRQPKQDNADALPYFTQEWSSGTAQEQTVTVDTGFGLIKQTISLAQLPKTVETTNQTNRPIQTVSSQQGNDGDEITESFAISEAGLLDLLIVIDDSDSMDGYQQKLGASLPSILTHINNTNWRIAVATTSDPCLRQTAGGVRILTKALYDSDPDAGKAALEELIDVPVKSSYERGILMGTDALQGICGADTTPWLRPSANISMLIVTDEENCGSASNEGCAGDAWESADYFTDVFGTTPTVHGLLLLADPDGSDPTCDNSGYYDDPPNPVNYIDLIDRTGGIYDDICSSDYSTVLEQISQTVSDKINASFQLTYEPSSALTLDIDGDAVSSHSVDADTLTINDAVDDTMTTLTVTYKHTPIAKTTVYPTGVAVDTSTLSVWVNNSKVDPSEYTYNAALQQVEFDALPPDRADIDVIFREDIALETSFSYSQDALDSSFEVWVDGVSSSFTVDKNNKKVILTGTPVDNAQVKISYAKPGDKTLTYTPVGEKLDIDALESISAVDTDTKEPIELTLDDSGKVVFTESDVWDGRNVEISYNQDIPEDQLTFQIPIQHSLDLDSLVITADEDAAVCSSDWKADDKQLTFTCSDEDFETISVRYQEVVEQSNSFSLDFDYAGPIRWAVFIDDKETDQFYRFDKTIVLLESVLKPGSTVRVEAHPLGSE